MKIFVTLLFVYTFLVLYVVFWAVKDWWAKKERRKNKNGSFGDAMKNDLKTIDRKTKDWLLGFSPREALKFLTDIIVAITAVVALLVSVH